MNNFKLTFLHDGKCPLCIRETNFLKNRDKFEYINFVDISSQKYDPSKYQNISYKTAMSSLHGILTNGKVIQGLDVLSYSYELVGLGWIYLPTKIKPLSIIFKFLYNFWAKYRLKITGRKNIEKLCTSRCEKIN